jgi:hypothetical protein
MGEGVEFREGRTQIKIKVWEIKETTRLKIREIKWDTGLT